MGGFSHSCNDGPPVQWVSECCRNRAPTIALLAIIHSYTEIGERKTHADTAAEVREWSAWVARTWRWRRGLCSAGELCAAATFGTTLLRSRRQRQEVGSLWVGGGVVTLCNTEILCNTFHNLGRRSCNTLSSCRLFLAETDTAGDSSDILTTKQEAQFQSGWKSWWDKKEVSIPTQGDLCYSLEIFGNNLS